MPLVCFNVSRCVCGARGLAVGWGTALQAGRSVMRIPFVSLEFLIDIILPTALWPWVRLNLKQKWVQEYFLGVKAAVALGWQLYYLHVPIVLKSGSFKPLEPTEPLQACTGITFTFTRVFNRPSYQVNIQAYNDSHIISDTLNYFTNP